MVCRHCIYLRVCFALSLPTLAAGLVCLCLCLLSFVETDVAIIVSSMPTFAQLTRKSLSFSGGRYASWLSRLFTSKSAGSSSEATIGPRLGAAGSSRKGFRLGSSDKKSTASDTQDILPHGRDAYVLDDLHRPPLPTAEGPFTRRGMVERLDRPV